MSDNGIASGMQIVYTDLMKSPMLQTRLSPAALELIETWQEYLTQRRARKTVQREVIELLLELAVPPSEVMAADLIEAHESYVRSRAL